MDMPPKTDGADSLQEMLENMRIEDPSMKSIKRPKIPLQEMMKQPSGNYEFQMQMLSSQQSWNAATNEEINRQISLDQAAISVPMANMAVMNSTT